MSLRAGPPDPLSTGATRPTVERGGGPVATGWFVNVLAQALPFTVFVLVTPTVLNAYGPTGYGALTVLLILPLIASQIDFGLVTTTTLLLARKIATGDVAGARRAYLRSLAAGFALGTGVALLLWLLRAPVLSVLNLAGSTGAAPYSQMVALCAWVACAFLAAAAATGLRARERFRLLAALQGAAGSAVWIAALILSLTKPTVTGALWFGAAASFATAAAAVVAVLADLRAMPSSVAGVRRDPWPTRFALGIFIAQLSTLATYHADRLLVSALVSPAAAGGYAVCVAVASKLLFVVAAVGAYALPRAARLHAQDARSDLAIMYASGTRVALLAVAVLGVPLIALAEPLLEAWIGAGFAERYGWTLRLLTLAYMLAAMSVVASNVVVAMQDSRTSAALATAGGALTVIGCALLAPRFGATGAALGALVGMSQAAVFNALVARRVRADPAQIGARFYASLAGLALISGGLLYLLSGAIGGLVAVAAALIVGASLMLGLWFALGFANGDEREMARQVWPRAGAVG